MFGGNLIGGWGCRTEGFPDREVEFRVRRLRVIAFRVRVAWRPCSAWCAVRATSRARQMNRAGPVRRSGNQAEAKAIWGGFSSYCLARVSRLEDITINFVHVFCTRLIGILTIP